MFVVKRVSLLEITKKFGKWYFICLRQKEFRCMPGLLFKYQKENIALKEKYLYVFPICLSVCLYFYLPVSLSAWISVCPCFWVSIWLLILVWKLSSCAYLHLRLKTTSRWNIGFPINHRSTLIKNKTLIFLYHAMEAKYDPRSI